MGWGPSFKPCAPMGLPGATGALHLGCQAPGPYLYSSWLLALWQCAAWLWDRPVRSHAPLAEHHNRSRRGCPWKQRGRWQGVRLHHVHDCRQRVQLSPDASPYAEHDSCRGSLRLCRVCDRQDGWVAGHLCRLSWGVMGCFNGGVWLRARPRRSVRCRGGWVACRSMLVGIECLLGVINNAPTPCVPSLL